MAIALVALMMLFITLKEFSNMKMPELFALGHTSGGHEVI